MCLLDYTNPRQYVFSARRSQTTKEGPAAQGRRASGEEFHGKLVGKGNSETDGTPLMTEGASW